MELVQIVGEAVHGPYWQKPLADDLNVNRRTINRWLSGISPVPDVMPDGTTLVQALLGAIIRREGLLVEAKHLIVQKMQGGVPQS